MGRSTVHYADNKTNNILKALHNKLRPAGTPVMRVEYIIELLLLRIFEVKLKCDKEFEPLRGLFSGENYRLLFSYLLTLNGNQAQSEMNKSIFPFYGNILGEARKVFSSNLPQKVQDQLVLIEEVFSNSSFTNNVKNGNLSEILSLINDIDEARLLKTDLLGDAIESALSEQGGTKDVGLYRTPDHIRHMMVTIVDPSFNDTIFDPACGTGGFLFDSFRYVMEKISKDKSWPGEKAHSEVKKYLDKYIEGIDTDMPSSNLAQTFYRTGISGIEYLGMIRKMAAINLYIRGLNPQNIEQGDSLDLFDPGVDAGTKSIVIANPPFGAELDQVAYPKVWEEYPKTESTTLFVRLMFNHLKNGGRCAVVVSEGFLTWDNEPAKEMRKILLEEANLKAIISLPQGVFVSKSGIGAKTSILYFEKGEPTKDIWFYKVTNDGYSSGVNRKEIPGSQIPEVLDHFTNYIKKGQIPPKTKHSFMIPVEQIRQIDPRLKERIIKDTTERNKAKFEIKINQESKKLKESLDKGKISKNKYDEKVWQLNNILETSTQNEITKRTEKAHLFSFNLQNYKSNLNENQIKKWKEIFNGIKARNGRGIDERYKELQKSDGDTALQILALFDPENSMEIDIAKEYIENLTKKSEKIQRLEKILKEGNTYPLMPLQNLLVLNENKIKPSKFADEKFVILGVSNTNGVFVNEKKKGSEIEQSYFEVEKNQFCYNPYRINVGSIGLNDFENGSRQIISGAYVVFGVNENEVNPRYLLALFESNKFNSYVNDQATGGVRMNFKFEYLQSWQIPLPPIEIQDEIVEKIDKQKEIINGAEKIIEKWDIDNSNFSGPVVELNKVINTQYGYTDSAKEHGNFRLVRITDIDRAGKLIDSGKVFVNISNPNDEAKYQLKKKDLLLVRTGATFGKMLFFDADELSVFASYLVRITPKDYQVLTKYIWYFSFSSKYWQQARALAEGGTQPQFNANKIVRVKIPLPSVEEQERIIGKLDKETESLEGIRKITQQAKARIEGVVNEIWGDNHEN